MKIEKTGLTKPTIKHAVTIYFDFNIDLLATELFKMLN